MASHNEIADKEEDEDELQVSVIPAVKISQNRSQHRGRAWEASNHKDLETLSFNHEGISNNNDNIEDDNDEEAVVISTRHAPVTTPQYMSFNGRQNVDMTPPNQKLTLSETAAQKLALKGKADKAIEEYIKCVAYSRIVFGDSHWKHAQSIINLGEAYLNLKGYYVQAEHHSENAHSLMLHGSHTASSEEERSDLYAVLIKIYCVMGEAATALKKYSNAEQALLKADKITHEHRKMFCVTDKECNKLDICLFQAMVRLYEAQKKYALASEKYDKLIGLMEAEYGKDSVQVMHAYMKYGKLEQSGGRHANHDKAIRLHLQAYSIASAIYKVGHPDLVDTALALSQAYASTGWEEAEGSAMSYLEESLSTCMTVHGPNHAKTLEVQFYLAKMMIRVNETKEAMQILKSSLSAKCETFGDYSEQVSDTYKLLGSIYLAEGKIETALRYYKKCYAIEVVLFGKNHKKTKDTQRTMDMLILSPSVSSKFVLNKADELQKRPRFNPVVGRVK